MGYKVIGAAAVVELDDGNPEIGTGRRVYVEQDVAVPADAKKAHVEHLLAIGIIEKSASAEKSAPAADGDSDSPAPAKSGGKSNTGA